MKELAGLAAAAILAASVVGGTGASAQDAPQGDVANGKRAYLAVGCMHCHGRAGQGGALNGPSPPLAKTELPFEAFRIVVRESLRDMPAYTEAVLADKDLVDMYAYLHTLPGRRAAKDIAILND
jgi:mono/diheme cytochrome c family protein